MTKQLIAVLIVACPAFPQAKQISLGSNSPNVSNVSGNVTITYACSVESVQSSPAQYSGRGYGYQPSASISLIQVDSLTGYTGTMPVPITLPSVASTGDTSHFLTDSFTSQLAGTTPVPIALPSVTTLTDSTLHPFNSSLIAGTIPAPITLPSIDTLTESTLHPFSDSTTPLFTGAPPTALLTVSGDVHVGDVTLDSISKSIITYAGGWQPNATIGLPRGLVDSTIPQFTGVDPVAITLPNGVATGDGTFDTIRPLLSETAPTGQLTLPGYVPNFDSLHSISDSTTPLFAGTNFKFIIGEDQSSLVKAISDITTTGGVVTGWAISYRAESGSAGVIR